MTMGFNQLNVAGRRLPSQRLVTRRLFGRAGVFGLVVDRPARTLGIEPLSMRLIS